jgi:hypothetical protein
LLKKTIPLILLVIITLLLPLDEAKAQSLFDTDKQEEPSDAVYLSFDVGFFLPVVTINVRLNYRLNDVVGWGVGANYFFMGGQSFNVEAFLKFSLVNQDIYEFPVSIGLIIGWMEEGSLGPEPKQSLGIGTHIVFEPAIIKAGDYSISLFNLGAQFITNFSGFAFSLYIGQGARYYF